MFVTVQRWAASMVVAPQRGVAHHEVAVAAQVAQCLSRTLDHRLEPLDPCLRALRAEAYEAAQHQPGGEQDLDGERDLGFPACGGASRRLLQAAGFL